MSHGLNTKPFATPAIMVFLEKHEHINAIREARSEFGLGLKEAKDLVDGWRDKPWTMEPPKPTAMQRIWNSMNNLRPAFGTKLSVFVESFMDGFAMAAGIATVVLLTVWILRS